MIVLDASAAVDFLLSAGARGEWVAERIGRPEDLAAPHLLDVEVAHAARRLVLGGKVEATRAERALGDLLRLDVVRYPHARLLDRIWRLRSRLSAYDAAYVALAEALDAPLLTTDARLARSTGHSAAIEGWPGPPA